MEGKDNILSFNKAVKHSFSLSLRSVELYTEEILTLCPEIVTVIINSSPVSRKFKISFIGNSRGTNQKV